LCFGRSAPALLMACRRVFMVRDRPTPPSPAAMLRRRGGTVAISSRRNRGKLFGWATDRKASHSRHRRQADTGHTGESPGVAALHHQGRRRPRLACGPLRGRCLLGHRRTSLAYRPRGEWPPMRDVMTRRHHRRPPGRIFDPHLDPIGTSARWVERDLHLAAASVAGNRRERQRHDAVSDSSTVCDPPPQFTAEDIGPARTHVQAHQDGAPGLASLRRDR
jgi:hypothetical protein